ncbi:ena/VASP-like protein [Anser cygnoides]|uniref:ena/VASP-like protein n=1 Tax=Anser cygnoides TaxID=8845 RepID=UPI0034D28969
MPILSFFSFVFSVLLVPTPQIGVCFPPSQHQPPAPASGASPLPPPHARAVPSPPAVPELARKSSLRCPGRASEPPQLLHRHSASELPTASGSSPPACPSHRPVMPSIPRTSLSVPPPHPSHFPLASRQPLRRSSLCSSPWTSAAPVTNDAPLRQRGDVLQPRGPTILPVIPAPLDRVREPTGKAGQEGLAGVPLNGHPKVQIASGSPRTQVRSVPGSVFPHLGATPSSQLPVIARPPGSFGQALSLSSPPSPRPPQQWCQPMSHCLPLPPPYAAGSEVTMPGRTPPYMTSSTISHLSKY